ncbi:MAG: putative ribonuclease [Actinomycetota bacterium]|jgi:ribonuclease D
MKWCLVTNRPEITYDWIDSNSDLIAFTQEALTESHFYLDTEFHREKTYFPQLALVQIATSKRTVIIDPLMVDMKLLRPLFDGPGMCVLHAAQQDLDVMAQSCGYIPSRMLDTQLCAGFLGYSQPSLASLLQSYLKVIVPKGDRLTDWLRRPLTNDQLRYAASDVAYLEEMSTIIFNELEERGRMQWAIDACEELRTRPTGPNPPEDAWLRVKDVRTLKGRSRWVAQSVAEWRENRAMDLDLPPRHVLSDIAILGIAQKAPRTAEEMLQSRGVDNRHVNGPHGRALLDAVKEGIDRSAEGDLSFPSHDGDDLDKSMRPAATLVSAWVTELARQSDLDAGLLGTRKDINDLLSGAPYARMGEGWRAEIVGHDIEDLVAGRKALTFTKENGGNGLRLVDVPSSEGN